MTESPKEFSSLSTELQKQHLRSVNLLSEFFDEFIMNVLELSSDEIRILYAKKSVFLGTHSPFGNREHTISNLGEGNPEGKFDLIFVNPSFTKMVNSAKDDPIINQLTGRLDVLDENGIAFLLLPSFELTLLNPNFREKLSKKNLFINGVFRLPANFLRPETSIRPLLACITKKETPIVLFADIENWEANSFGQFECLSQNLLNTIQTDWKESLREKRGDPSFIQEFDDIEWDDLWNGVYSNFDKFLGFEYWYYNDELARLNSDYKEFKSLKLGEICHEIKLIRSGESFDTDSDGCIYIPLIGTQLVVDEISKFKIKHHNYARLKIDTGFVDQSYVVNFLNSKIGRLIIETEKSIGNHFIPKLTIKKIQNLEIKIPEIQLQRRLTQSVIKINEIFSKVEGIKSEIEMNPLTAKDIDKLDSILASMTEFTIQDEVRQMISFGENKKTEFKETLSLDRATRQKNKLLEHSSLKTIVAFLNSDGGTLIIGVSDQLEVIGIEEEINKFHKDRDNFLLHLKNLIKRSIGEEFYTLIETNLITIDDKVLAIIETMPSDSEVYLDGKEFFVRTNPATDKLEGRRLVEYCKRRFFKTKD
ncbi:putative DNA binding domain-containing protein [Candidatus Puniceispirillum sp.]|nr:putative DNA binding domain-containing protein [Candidatus Puniceispirillum sp.]